MTKWLKEEEGFFEKAWSSDKYDRKTLEEIFGRTYNTMRAKADAMGLEDRAIIEQRTRLESIRKTLEEAHVL